MLKVVLRKEQVDLLLHHFDDFSVMGILLKIVCIETQTLSEMTGDSYFQERKQLLFKILDKFLSLNSDPSGSIYDDKSQELDLTKNISELMNGGAFFRYMIKDMNVIDSAIIDIIKDVQGFFERALSPLFSVLSSNSG